MEVRRAAGGFMAKKMKRKMQSQGRGEKKKSGCEEKEREIRRANER